MKKRFSLKTFFVAILALIIAFGTIPASAATDYDIVFSEDEKTLIYYPASLTDSEYVIPDGVEIIGEAAFSGNGYLENIVFPETVKVIEHAAFNDCTALKSITLPASIERFCTSDNYNAGSFSGCVSLEEFIVDEANKVYKSIDGVVYTKDGKKLVCYPINKQNEDYTIIDGTEIIGWNSFSDVRYLKHLTIPDGVKEIEGWAFIGCSIETLAIPKSMKKIGWSAVDDCDNLTTIYYAGNVKEFDSIDINKYKPDLSPDNTDLFEAELICEEKLSFFENIAYIIEQFFNSFLQFIKDIRDRGQIPSINRF